jgi:hypothetical protein
MTDDEVEMMQIKYLAKAMRPMTEEEMEIDRIENAKGMRAMTKEGIFNPMNFFLRPRGLNK